MYSVFLVEDEIVIREGIKQLVAWEEYGFTFIGEAPDGELAWPIIQQRKPDIVITDIRMPFMDGLELSKLIKKELPYTIVIILSGHDDFTYAKEAIGIGVNQYLLKPLSKDQLIEVLLEVKKKRDEDLAQEQYKLQLANEVKEYLSSYRRGFFDALVSGELSMPALLERAQKLDLDLVAEQYNIVLFLLEEDIIHDSYSYSIDQIQNEISNTFADNEHFVTFSAGMGVTAFLVKANNNEILLYTQECIDNLTRICMSAKDRVQWLAVSGQPVTRLSAVADCYKKTRKRLFYNEGSIISQPHDYKHPEDFSKSISIDFNLNEMDASKMDSRVIEKFLSNGLQEDVESFAEDYLEGFGSEGMKSVLFLQYVVLSVRFAVNAFLEKLGIDKTDTDNDGERKKELILAMNSMEASKAYVVRLFFEALRLRDSIATSRYQDLLKNAVAYMEKNYADPDIGLNTVAQIANVTPTHFSTVFSQHMGKTFVEYLTELRMEKARELLRCTSDSSSEIAYNVGYNDPHYFSSLFKRVNGCSPKGYRIGRR